MPEADTRMKVQGCIKLLKDEVIDDPNCKLMFAIFERAVLDFFLGDGYMEKPPPFWHTAKDYLGSDLVHLKIAGVDVSHARQVLDDAGLELPIKKQKNFENKQTRANMV